MAATPLTNKREIYADFNTDFTVHPVKKDLTRLTNEDAVKRSIKNILLTNSYERRFRPAFGANIRRHLFENVNPLILEVIKDEIISAITNYEPRAEIVDVTVSSLENDDNAVNVKILFTIINSLQVVTITTTITMDRVR